jgi:hypothetical protein
VFPDVGARSGLEVDGLNAYAPGAISSLTGEAGFNPLAYSSAFNAAHDTVTITETNHPMICDPPGGYPPTSSTCPALHDSGLQIQQTSTLLPGGQVARVTQRVSSVDGRSHTIDALFSQSVQAQASGEVPGFEFPGQGSFASHAVPDTFSVFPPGPSSIIVLSDAVAGPATSNPIGAITYDRPPISADFLSSAGNQTATFLMHYLDTVPASGSVVYDWSYSQAASGTTLAPLERVERDRFTAPTIRINHPRSRLVTGNRHLSVSGTASDNVGLTSVTVNGHQVGTSATGVYATVTALRPGRNVITVVATNQAGNATTASVTVTYRPPPCRVPKLQGKTVAAARIALTNAGCVAGKITKIRSRTIRKGRVISSRPAPGTRHRPFTKVGLVVSRGR